MNIATKKILKNYLYSGVNLLLDQVSALKGLLSGEGGYFVAIAEAHIAFVYWILFGNKKWKPAARKKLHMLSGVYGGNLVWEHFVKKRTTFSQIVPVKKV